MQPAERLVNLIAFLLDETRPATADDIRELVAGYSADQSDAAFQRMFERDKDDLRELGIPVVVTENEAGEPAYSIDRESYYLPPIDVDYEEALALRLAGRILAADPGYPLGEEISSALAKLACDCDPPGIEHSNLTIRIAPEAVDETEKANLTALRSAIEGRKTATFSYYSISADSTEARTIEPYGLFNADGHWYLVARCRTAEALRTFRLSRIRGPVGVSKKHPREPDFQVPPDFDLNSFIRHPWEFGERRFHATVRFERPLAGWARRALYGAASLTDTEDGAVIVVLSCGDEERLLRWVLSFGPDATLLAPAAARALAYDTLSRSLALYTGATL